MGEATNITLVIGGARSGKSRRAEEIVLNRGLRPVYVATAEARDAEMAERIRRHRDRRGAAWTTHEAPLDLAGAIRGHAAPDAVLLIDCLTLWLANLLEADREPEAETDVLLAALTDAAGPVVLVSNEVGWGIVPDNALARAFRDRAGRLNQAVAVVADRVELVVAGLPMVLK